MKFDVEKIIGEEKTEEEKKGALRVMCYNKMN